jgi:endoglucanase
LRRRRRLRRQHWHALLQGADRRAQSRGESTLTDGFEKEMVAANKLNRVLDAIRWGTNYFIKAHTEPNGLWVQVGDGDSDHRGHDHTAYGVQDQPAPPGLRRRRRDGVRAGRGLQGVQALRLHVLGPAAAAREAELFTLTDTFRTRYDGSLQGSRKFYPSASGYQDELLWAAAWLYEATGEAGYLQCISQNAEAFGGVD